MMRLSLRFLLCCVERSRLVFRHSREVCKARSAHWQAAYFLERLLKLISRNRLVLMNPAPQSLYLAGTPAALI